MECLYPPKFTGWNPNSPRGGVRRAKPPRWDPRLIKTPGGALIVLPPPEATCPWEPKPHRRPDPGFRSLRGHGKQIAEGYGTPGLWPFVRATWTKIGRQRLSQRIKIFFFHFTNGNQMELKAIPLDLF